MNEIDQNGIEELDRLDEENRLNELNTFLDDASYTTYLGQESEDDAENCLKEFLNNDNSAFFNDDTFSVEDLNAHNLQSSTFSRSVRGGSDRYNVTAGDSLERESYQSYSRLPALRR
jgi:hypothetical protein